MLLLAIIASLVLGTMFALARAIQDGGHWPEAIILAVITAVCLLERTRRRPLDRAKPPPPWEPTTERFVDTETGNLVQVWQLPATGERRYVDVGAPAAPLA